jgi:hypothetical protein
MLNFKRVCKDKGVKTMKEKKSELVPAHRSPPRDPSLPVRTAKELYEDFDDIRRSLEKYAFGLRPLDRRRLKGVGIATQGFISRAFDSAVNLPGALPEYTPIEKFRRNYAAFEDFHSLLILSKQIEKTLMNITMVTANIAYEDALDFYGAVNKGAKKGMETYVTVYNDLFKFFKKGKREGAAPTQEKVIRDARALLRGKKDGRVVIENVSPKIIGGEHEVVDETAE